MTWTAKTTGNMTLSILDEDGFKVLGVDMLRTNTMRAGDGGELLARTLNDLGLLAQAADTADEELWVVADPSAGLSPRPWQFDFRDGTRRVSIRDADGRLMGDRMFPKSTCRETLGKIVITMRQAVVRVNASNLG